MRRHWCATARTPRSSRSATASRISNAAAERIWRSCALAGARHRRLRWRRRTQFSIDRRSLFEGTGALVYRSASPGGFAAAESGAAIKLPLAADYLDSWLAVDGESDIVAYFGKMDMGQSVDVAIAQIVADELLTCHLSGSVSIDLRIGNTR